MTARRPPRYPGLPTPDAFTGEQRAYLERLQELLQNTTGLKGDPKERVPTIRELEAVGVIKTTVKNSQAEIRPGDGLQSTIQSVHVPRVRWQDIIGKPDFFDLADEHLHPGKEDALGDPVENGYVLSSLTDGTRSWIAQGGSGVGGVLPLVTGEVPPVLVYLDDGSLVYSGVE